MTPEMGKSVRGQVLKSKVQFGPFPIWGTDPQRVGFQLCLDSGKQSGLGCRLGHHWYEMTSRALDLNDISMEGVYLKKMMQIPGLDSPNLQGSDVREEGISKEGSGQTDDDKEKAANHKSRVQD